MQEPVCSVVIPVYNGEKYIEECLRSALSQTLREIEILVVDDASTDRTRELVSAFCREDERVRLLCNEGNRGVAETRNRGVREARAAWIAFLDSDDAWLPGKLEKQFALQKRSGARLLYTGAACMDSSGKSLERSFTPPERIDYRELLCGNEIVCSTVLAEKALLTAFPMTESRLHEDYICWLRILREIGEAFGLKEDLICYRFAVQSKSRNKWKSARMTWESYVYLGIPFLERCVCFLRYALHGLKRYFL